MTNQQQLDCLFKHIEHSQNLNLWHKQTESSSCDGNKKLKQFQVVSPNQSSTSTHQEHHEPSITKVKQQQKPKLEWVVLPVFIDIVKLALKAREDCSTRYLNETTPID